MPNSNLEFYIFGLCWTLSKLHSVTKPHNNFLFSDYFLMTYCYSVYILLSIQCVTWGSGVNEYFCSFFCTFLQSTYSTYKSEGYATIEGIVQKMYSKARKRGVDTGINRTVSNSHTITYLFYVILMGLCRWLQLAQLAKGKKSRP